MDAVLAVPWLVPEPDGETLLALESLVLEPLGELPVALDVAPGSEEDEVMTHGATVVVLGDEALVPLGGAVAVEVAEAVVSEASRAEHVEAVTELVSVPVASLPDAAVSVLDAFETAEAPVEAEIPAPPAVGLWRGLGLDAVPTDVPAVAASFGAVDTVASTTPTMAWMPGAWWERPAMAA